MTTHSTRPPSGTPKLCAMTGSDTLTIDESIVAMSTPMATTAKTAHLLGCVESKRANYCEQYREMSSKSVRASLRFCLMTLSVPSGGPSGPALI